MKFFHLSDLHIGKAVNGFSMLDEQKQFFNQVIEYIKNEKPAAVIIAGDVYDRQIPGVEAVQTFDDFITELAKTKIHVMLISGNHDSPQRLGFASRLLSGFNLHFYGSFDGEMRKVTLKDEFGEINFWLLPFVKPASVQGMFPEKEIESYDDVISAIMEKSEIEKNERNVLVSHQFYTRANLNPVRSDSESSPIGGLDAVNADLIKMFDYAALGHLHGGQAAGADNIRYCGSPVKYSFSEWQHEKSILMVELGKKNNLKIKTLPVKPIHDMRVIKGELEELLNQKKERADREDYLRVVLTDEGEIIDPMGKLRGIYPNIMSIGFENSKSNINLDSIARNIEEIDDISPYELFSRFFIEVNGSAMNEEQEKIVAQLFEQEHEE